MVDLWKELERRKEKRLTRARYIKHIRFVLCLMICGLGLVSYLFGKTFDLQPEGSHARIVIVGIQLLTVCGQVAILWLMWWSHRVLRHDQRKL